VLLLTPLLLGVEEVVAREDMLMDVVINTLEDWLEEPLKDTDEPLAAAETELDGLCDEVVKLTVELSDPVLVFAEREVVVGGPLPDPIEDVDGGEAVTEEAEPAEEDELIRLAELE
jgi:hypothetical protein